jgi:hypothetical protein
MADKTESDATLAPGFRPRRVERSERGGRTQLTPQNLYKIEVNVRNISACGFMAECGGPVRIGSYVSLDVPGVGPVHAQVRWQIGARMGGMFLDPISLNRCEWVAEKAEA